MSSQERTDRLREIMRKYDLTAAEVGQLLNREPQTIRNWSCASEDRVIPWVALELLEMKVEACRAFAQSIFSNERGDL